MKKEEELEKERMEGKGNKKIKEGEVKRKGGERRKGKE